MNRADAGAGQHGDGSFRNHWQGNKNAVALLNAIALEDIGKLTNIVMELLVGEGALFAWLAGTGGLALPDEGGFVSGGGAEVPVKTVVTDVEPATAEPFRVRFLPRN